MAINLDDFVINTTDQPQVVELRTAFESSRFPHEQSEVEKLVTYRGSYSYTSRAISRSRNRYLTSVNEERSDISTYKKYLLISLKGTEIFKLNQGTISSLIRKNVPDWVIKQVNDGIEVEALVYVEWNSPIYFKHGSGNTVMRLTNGIRGSIGRDPNIRILNDRYCAKFKINNVIKTVIDKNGEYSDSIKDIAELNNISIDKLRKFGKIKPIYSLGVSELTFLTDALEYYTLLTRFTVTETRNEDGELKFMLNVTEVLNRPYNMGTIWI